MSKPPPFPAVTVTANEKPMRVGGSPEYSARVSPFKASGGDSFRVVVVHNDAGTFLYDLTATTIEDARASAAARTKYNASAYLMPGFEIYRAGVRIPTK